MADKNIQDTDDSLPDLSKPNILILTDRTREVTYNGDEIRMNTFMCSSCKGTYHFEEYTLQKFCPFCGQPYLHKEDISV